MSIKKTTALAETVVFSWMNHNFGFKQVLYNNIAPRGYMQW
jgi:hypothetical protein